MNRGFDQYQQAQQQIQQQMGQMKFDSSREMAMALPGWSTGQQNSMAQANQVGPGTPYGPTPGPNAALGNAMGAVGGMMAGGGFGGLGGGVRGGTQPTNAQFNRFGGNYAGATPAGYTGTIQRF
jgi:hypothetical protein